MAQSGVKALTFSDKASRVMAFIGGTLLLACAFAIGWLTLAVSGDIYIAQELKTVCASMVAFFASTSLLAFAIAIAAPQAFKNALTVVMLATLLTFLGSLIWWIVINELAR